MCAEAGNPLVLLYKIIIILLPSRLRSADAVVKPISMVKPGGGRKKSPDGMSRESVNGAPSSGFRPRTRAETRDKNRVAATAIRPCDRYPRRFTIVRFIYFFFFMFSVNTAHGGCSPANYRPRPTGLFTISRRAADSQNVSSASSLAPSTNMFPGFFTSSAIAHPSTASTIGRQLLTPQCEVREKYSRSNETRRAFGYTKKQSFSKREMTSTTLWALKVFSGGKRLEQNRKNPSEPMCLIRQNTHSNEAMKSSRPHRSF